MFNKILVVAAHSDDEILGCGGSLMELTKDKWHPHIAVIWCEDLEQMYSAGECLMLDKGCYTTCNRLIPYREFCKVKVKLISFLEKVIEKVKPDTIFYHYADNNQDHKVVNEVVKIACRRFKGSLFEYLVCVPAVGIEFYPNFYVNISGCIRNKLEALSKYSDRINESKAPLDIESLKCWYRYLGIKSGFKYAEGFKMIRGVR